MNGLLKSLQTNDSLTANGMVTNSTSLDANLDMFFLAGASRTMSERDIIAIFSKARAENPLSAMKVLFWSRDIRGGAGERKFFNIIIKHLATHYPEYLFNTENFKLIPEFGTWKEIISLIAYDKFADKVYAFIKAGLENKDTQSLVAKWLPRKGPEAAMIRKGIGMSPKEYRKTIVALSNVVESKMADKDYSAIEYSKIPSKAFNKYRKAFERNDPERFSAFLESVKKGDEKINAGAIFPHVLYKQMREDIMWGSFSVRNMASEVEKDAIVEQWNSLPNYLEGNDERILPVCDVSGSMTTTIDNSGTMAMDISVSFGLYFSERLEGPFKDAFITFSDRPELNYLKGGLFEKVTQLSSAAWGMSTNLEATFKLLLDKAKAGNVAENEMPTKILIFSDMQFNACVRNPESGASKMIKDMYAEAGYKVPNVIFWNLKGKIGNVPAQANSKNVALLSGFSPASVKGVLGGEVLTPAEVMLNVINSERYSLVSVPK